MNIRAVDEAIVEMKRFRDAAYAVKKIHPERKKGKDLYESSFFGSPETGALRRASLDLTRALARMRK